MAPLSPSEMLLSALEMARLHCMLATLNFNCSDTKRRSMKTYESSASTDPSGICFLPDLLQIALHKSNGL